MNVFGDEFETDHNTDELSPGTELMLGQYQITRYLNSGGFGITYLAKDSLDRPVVIKECFPRSFCRRSNMLVQARSQDDTGELRAIVRLFTNEARALSKLNHPFIVGVHQVFEDNNTAYMALDFVEGHDLLAVIEQKVLLLRPDQITAILQKALDAIKFVHAGGLLHRDISPDNIIVTNELNPVLIDFGAAREQATKTTRALSALRVVKDGYSPQEFYIAGSEQGPSSDLYSLAASFYHLITGELPPDSQMRIAAHVAGQPDPYIPLHLKTSNYSASFCDALDKAMAILPKDRMQSADEWLVDLAQPQRTSRNVSQIMSRPRSRQISRVAPGTSSRRPGSLRRYAAWVAGGAVAASAVLAYPYAQSVLPSDLATQAEKLLSAADDGERSSVLAAATTQPDEVTSGSGTPPLPQTPVIPQAAPESAKAAALTNEPAETILASLPKPAGIQPTPLMPPSTASSEPSQSAALQSFETSYANGALAADWQVTLPFTLGSDAMVLSVTEDAPAWVSVGTRILQVNGAPVSGAADVENAVRADAMNGDGTSVTFSMRVQHADDSGESRGDIEAGVSYHVQLADQYYFKTTNTGARWETVVTDAPVPQSPDAPALQTGDIIVAVLDTDQDAKDGSGMTRMLARQIESGAAPLKLAIDRGGVMWIVDLDVGA
ncbi:MAG: protein kinase [Pseudomonadota bacterium]